MQKFRLITEEIGESLKLMKKQRNDELKQIKQLYQDLEDKQLNPFQPTLSRITHHLSLFKDSEYKSAHAGVDVPQILQRNEGKLDQINSQIAKLNKVIQKGCGNIVEKSLTSRVTPPSQAKEHKQISRVQQLESRLEEES